MLGCHYLCTKCSKQHLVWPIKSWLSQSITVPRTPEREFRASVPAVSAPKSNYFFLLRIIPDALRIFSRFFAQSPLRHNESRTGGQAGFLSTPTLHFLITAGALQNIRPNYVFGLENRIYSWSQCRFHLPEDLGSLLPLCCSTCPCHDKHNFRHESWSMRFAQGKGVACYVCFPSLFGWMKVARELEREGWRTINGVNEPNWRRFCYIERARLLCGRELRSQRIPFLSEIAKRENLKRQPSICSRIIWSTCTGCSG